MDGMDLSGDEDMKAARVCQTLFWGKVTDHFKHLFLYYYYYCFFNQIRLTTLYVQFLCPVDH